MNVNPKTEDLENAYTDAPEPHLNLILGSLQLLGWLFFHPAAWRNHITRIDPTLRPDFALIELSRAQWRNPAVRRLVFQGCVVWSLLFAFLTGPALWMTSNSSTGIAYNSTLFIVCFVGINVTLGMGPAMALVAGTALFYGIETATASDLTYNLANGGIGIMGSVLISLVNQEQALPLTRRLGGIAVGILLGSVASGAIGGLMFLASNVVSGIATSLIFGVGIGMAFLLLGRWRAHSWRRGIVIGVVVGVVTISMANSTAPSLVSGEMVDDAMSYLIAGILDGILVSTWFSAILTLTYVLTKHIAGPRIGALTSTLCMGGTYILLQTLYEAAPPLWLIISLCLISLLLGLTQTYWRPVLLYPFTAAWNTLLYRADERRSNARSSLLRFHSAFWDEHQRLPLSGLDDHLVLVMERNPVEGQAAIEYLSTTRQRWAARAAQIELDARHLQRCLDVKTIGNADRDLGAGELEGPISALLRSFGRVSQDVGAALRQESGYNQRLALSAVEERLDSLLRELTRSGDRYAVRFRPIVTSWRQVVADHVRVLAAAAEQRQEIESPYIIGVPLTAQQEIFVGRTNTVARIEELLLDHHRPPILLYGQRRMGKTSLLNNLGRLMPSTIIPLFVDLQGPASQATDHAGLLYNLARGMTHSARQQRNLPLPPLARQALADDPFTRFDEWLDAVEGALGNCTALLALDEFEALESALVEGRFSETAVLGTLRHLIQHRPRFKVLLAGSHTLSEVQRWASYLINVEMVHLSYLNETEARRLIKRPVADFALSYEPDASQRVLNLTHGHPALVQLLCAEIVALKNSQPPTVRRLACLADVEAATPEAIRRGSFFFADIERNQVDSAERTALRFIAAHGERVVVSQETLADQFPAALEQTLALLTQRELIEPVGDGYCFQVEMIRRWFA